MSMFASPRTLSEKAKACKNHAIFALGAGTVIFQVWIEQITCQNCGEEIWFTDVETDERAQKLLSKVEAWPPSQPIY